MFDAGQGWVAVVVVNQERIFVVVVGQEGVVFTIK